MERGKQSQDTQSYFIAPSALAWERPWLNPGRLHAAATPGLCPSAILTDSGDHDPVRAVTKLTSPSTVPVGLPFLCPSPNHHYLKKDGT